MTSLPCFFVSPTLYVIVFFSCILHLNPCFISNATVMYHFVVCIWTSPWWCHWEPCWLSENFANFHMKGKNIISGNFVLSESNLTLIQLTWRIWWAPNNASKWKMGFNLAFKGLIFPIDKKHFSFNLREIFYIKNETVSFRFLRAAEISVLGTDSRQCHCKESGINYSFTSINTQLPEE